MKVFVSSTTKDLGDARKKVCEQLLQLDIQPDGMDFYTSDPNPPKQLDHDKVNGCDAFVIIVGQLYGSIPEGEEQSFTELEYDAAVETGKDIYTFLTSDEFPPTRIREEDAKYQKLQEFREKLAEDHSPRYFDSIGHLCAEVAAAIPRPTAQAGKIIVPKLPQPYLAHPYPLQENFTGRLKERAMLTEWVSRADSKPMLSLVGMGGLGKSALTWFWLHEDLPQEKLKFSGIIWWSFYESRASFESFLSHALLYASGGTINPAQIPSDYDRMQSLLCILHDSPFLIVFDGAERLLRAYHALDAAYKGDDFGKEAGDKHLFCADPRAGAFMQALADPWVKTRTLLTTRLHPKELHGLAGCQKEDLEQLDSEDVVEFMRRQGIKGPRNAIIHACEPYEFLPLCLRLLSGAIREDPKKPNDIDAAEDWHPPADLKDTQRQHHILQLTYDTMSKNRRDLLSRIAAMRGPVDYDTAKVLSTYEDENELKESLRELVARGLLFRREEQTNYDLHPIVRQYAYDRLGDKMATHKALKDYFDTVPKPEKIETLDDLMPTIELFHHTIKADGYEKAYRIYKDRLINALYFQIGAYDMNISLIKAFFLDEGDQTFLLKDESEQAWILNSLAAAYLQTGQSHQAIGLLKLAINIAEKQGEKRNIAIGICHLALHQILMGKLKEAESNLRLGTNVSREINDKFNESITINELGRLLVYMGQYDQADKELETALSMEEKHNYEQIQCVSWFYRGLRAILMDELKLALNTVHEARQSWELYAKNSYPIERNLVWILWLSGAAKRLSVDTAGAEVDLNDALSRCRRIRLVELESDILLEMAKLQWQKAEDGKQKAEDRGLVEQAKSLTHEALDIADRCEYRLKQADIHNFLAEMAFAEGDKAAALKHAETARERAYCDGPPYCYKKALDEAEQMLATLK